MTEAATLSPEKILKEAKFEPELAHLYRGRHVDGSEFENLYSLVE